MKNELVSVEDVVLFGELVKQGRTARGWSQEALALEALSNEGRKGYVSQVENGRIPNLTVTTVRNFAVALEIPVERIPASLRWPEVVQQQDVMIDRFVEKLEVQARDFGLKEGLLIALARRYAPDNPTDFDSALASIETLLKLAHESPVSSDCRRTFSTFTDRHLFNRIESMLFAPSTSLQPLFSNFCMYNSISYSLSEVVAEYEVPNPFIHWGHHIDMAKQDKFPPRSKNSL